MSSITTRSIALLSLIVSAGVLIMSLASLRSDSTHALPLQQAIAAASTDTLRASLSGAASDRAALARGYYLSL